MKTISLTFILLTATIGLAGCNSAIVADPFLQTSSVAPEAEALATEVAPEYAAAFLPSLAGSIQSVRQSVRNHYLRQEIVYANQTYGVGENILTVTIGAAGDDANLRPPSEGEVRREMRQALAGMNVTMSPLIRDNVQGAYGYATAAYGKDGSCIFAWQHVKNVSPADVEGYVQFTQKRLSGQVRLRYCHPSIPQDRIAVMMDGLRVKQMNADTINILRFAAGNAHVAAPPSVVHAETIKPVVKRTVDVSRVEDDEDWRKSVELSKDSEEAGAIHIRKAVAIPLPENAEARVSVYPAEASRMAAADAEARQRRPTFQADGDGEILRKQKAAAIPLPQ